MANLLNELVYTSLDDARDTSDLFSATTPDDTTLTKYITNAQWIIDEYIIAYGEPFVETQTFIFPVEDENEESLIPADIQLATVWIAEYLYLRGTETTATMEGKEVLSEENLSRSIKYSDSTGGYLASIDTVQIPKKAQRILDGYKQRFIGQVI